MRARSVYLLVTAVMLASGNPAPAGERCEQDGDEARYSGVQLKYEGTTKVRPSGDGAAISWSCFFENASQIIEIRPTLRRANNEIAQYRVEHVKLNVVYHPGWTQVAISFLRIGSGRPGELKMGFFMEFSATASRLVADFPNESGVIEKDTPLKGPIVITTFGQAGDPAAKVVEDRWLYKVTENNDSNYWISVDSLRNRYYLPQGACLNWTSNYTKQPVVYSGVRLGTPSEKRCPPPN